MDDPTLPPDHTLSDGLHYDRVINETMRIRQMLENCGRDQDRVEIHLGDQVRAYFTTLKDHPPQTDTEAEATPVDTEAGEEAPSAKNVGFYQPWDYLKRSHHLLLEPLTPAKGNLILRTRTEKPLLLRFFRGVDAMEAMLHFQGLTPIGELTAIQISYPRTLGVIRKRRHFRMRLGVDNPLKAAISVDGTSLQGVPVTIQDISAGGLSFSHTHPAELLPLDELARITLRIPGELYLRVPVWIRNHGPVTVEMLRQGTCHPQESLCGVQFDLADGTVETKINELVASQQLDAIAKDQDDLPFDREPSSLLLATDENKPPAQTEEPAAEPQRETREPVEEKKGEKREKKGSWLEELLGSDKKLPSSPLKAAPPRPTEEPKRKLAGKEAEMANLLELKKKRGF